MEKLKAFYDEMETNKIRRNAIFVFVYNNESTYEGLDDPHIEECYSDAEVDEVVGSVSDLFETVKSYGTEQAFFKACSNLCATKRPIYVYTMAQTLTGYNRRVLIPCICLYHGFININADPYMSAIGCNKETLYHLIDSYGYGSYIPTTIYLESGKNFDINVINNIGSKVVLKPICESCCIDVKFIGTQDNNEVMREIDFMLQKYSKIMVQEYIEGDEIGISIFYHDNLFYALQPIKIGFRKNKHFLTSNDSYYSNYDLVKVEVPKKLLRDCEELCRCLNFKCITRLDFRKKDDHYFLFDISPNPTLSDFSSCSYAVRYSLDTDFRGVYRLLVFEKLFKPAFDDTK